MTRFEFDASRNCVRLSFVMAALQLAAISGMAATIPILSTGALGAFAPTGNVVFDTTSGTYTMGNSTFTGGRVTPIDSSVQGLEAMVFDFSNILIPAGVTVTATGNSPLFLLAQGSATINGTIDVGGQAGGSGGAMGGGGGGGGGGGAAAIFADSISIGSTGRILAVGGDGGTSDAGGNTQNGGLGGLAGPNGGAGGTGGGSVAGGEGGAGGDGPFFHGAGGGGAGGGGFDGPGGAGGHGGGYFFNRGGTGANGGSGGCTPSPYGGVGGTGAGGKDAFAGTGGNGGTINGGQIGRARV